MSFRHHEIATAGETRQTDVILDPTHIFHGRRTIVLFWGENACDATQPDRQACATLPIDKALWALYSVRGPLKERKKCVKLIETSFVGRCFA